MKELAKKAESIETLSDYVWWYFEMILQIMVEKKKIYISINPRAKNRQLIYLINKNKNFYKFQYLDGSIREFTKKELKKRFRHVKFYDFDEMKVILERMKNEKN